MNLLISINLEKIAIVLLLVAVLTIIFTLLIVLVSFLCHVKVDEKVSAINDKLSGANCGGCGFAGCSDFAKALAEGKTDLSKCSSTSKENKTEIAKILGVEVGDTTPKFAVVCCNGGVNAKDKFNYVGNRGCENTLMGGNKVCSFACIGEGTCVLSCPHGGIKVENGVAIIDRKLCEGCGACIIKCPKSIIKLIPKSSKVYVACSSKCKGKDVLGACSVGCIGCGLCAKQCPNGAISMVDNLPIIDYTKCTGCGICAEKCPKKCIHKI